MFRGGRLHVFCQELLVLSERAASAWLLATSSATHPSQGYLEGVGAMIALVVFPCFLFFFCCCGGCDTMTIYIISWILMRVGTICVCVGVLTCFGLGISQSQWRGRAAGSTTPDSTISRTWSCNLKPSTAFQCCTGTSKLAARWRSVLQHSRS